MRKVAKGLRYQTGRNQTVHGKTISNPVWVVTCVRSGIIYSKMEEYPHFVPVDEKADSFLRMLENGEYVQVHE